jgi:hypothetical protein
MYEDIHVGLAHRTDTVELVPGDAPRAAWSFEVNVRHDDTGAIDLTGPFVHGTRGDRHLGLRWVTLTPEDELSVFRAAKLKIAHIDPSMLADAVRRHLILVAEVGLTDEHGHPICATIKPPLVVWHASEGTGEEGGDR